MGIDTEIWFNKKDLKKADWLVFFHAIELYTKIFATRWYWMRDTIFNYPTTPLKSKEILMQLKGREFKKWNAKKKKWIYQHEHEKWYTPQLDALAARANQDTKFLFEYVCPTIRIVLQSDAEKPYRNKNYISGYDLITSFQKNFKV